MSTMRSGSSLHGRRSRTSRIGPTALRAQIRDARHALEESRQRYADLYDFAPLPYFTFDAHGVIAEMNLAAATLLQQERSTAVGVPFPALVALEDPPAFWDHLSRCAAERGSFTSELAFKTNRRRVEAQLASTPVLGDGGAVEGFRTAVIDLSERHEALRERRRALAEQVLRHQIEDLDQACAALAEALASERSPSPAVLRIIVERARVLVGAEYAALGVAKAPGEPFEPFLYAGVEKDVIERIGRTPRAVGLFGVVVRDRRPFRLKDLRESPDFTGFPPGHPRMTSFLCIPVVLGDHLHGSLYVANKRGKEEFTEGDVDILERFADRAAITCEIARLQDVTRDAVRARDRMLAIVSHDLRSPLASILLACDVLSREAPKADRRKGRRRIDTIQRTASHMKRLVEDLLTATTVEAGTLSTHPEPTSVPEIVEEALQMLQPQAAEQEVRIEARVPPALPLACCDRARIVQVLCNLVGNAVKFSPRERAVQVDLRQEGAEIVLSVLDEGPGIPADELEHVFDRAWDCKPRTGGGLGLGLYIARGIVAAHGGRIWARSEVGRGSAFMFTLPVA
jgi:PAS domain S-box-containing protein